jgi:hypothetical protein
MLCVAAALALAVVLALAGVLGSWGLVLRDKEHAGVGRSAVLSGGLCVEASGRTAKKTSECGREGQVVCSVDFHWEHLSWLGRAVFAGRNDVVGSVGTEPLDARWGYTTCSKRENGLGDKGYKFSLWGIE